MDFSNRQSYVCGATALGLLLAAPLLIITSTPAAAAEASTQSAANGAAKTEADELQEVVITGSSIRGVAPVGSESITLDKAAIEETGLTNIGQVLSTLPQFQNNSAGGNSETPGPVQNRFTGATFGGNQSRNTGIDLRGLGNDATLVLIDGHRATPSGGESVVDANQIPLAALERVEIVADGASAVYGSDAVAGVVNYVLRKDYDGMEGSARLATQRGTRTVGGSFVFGHKWGFLNGGNAMITIDTEHRSALASDSSPYLMQDQLSVGGNNRVGIASGSATPPSLIPYVTASACPAGQLLIPTGPPNFLPPACINQPPAPTPTPLPGPVVVYYGVNTPQSGTARPTLAQLQAAGVPAFVDTGRYGDYLSARRRNNVALYLRQDINETVQLSAQAAYQRREDNARGSLVTANSTVTPASPYYIAGIAPGNYTAVTPLGVSTNRQRLDALNSTATMKVKLPRQWETEVSYTFNFSRDSGSIFNRDDGLRVVAAALNRSVLTGGANSFNPYSLTNPQSTIDTFRGSQETPNTDYYHDGKVKFDGPLFKLPGGVVKIAVGAEWSRENAVRTQFSAVDTPPGAPTVRATLGPSNITQVTTSEFVEVNVPLVSSLNAKPGVKLLTLSLAGRRDDYSTLGDSVNPKYGITWKPLDDLTLRGSYSTSFRQPGLQQGTSNPNDVNVIAVPSISNGTTTPSPYAAAGVAPAYILFVGRRNDLQPQTSENFQFGVDYTPSWLDGLKLSATYYDVDYRNKIDSPNYNGFLTSNASADAYATNITLLNQNITQPTRCVPGNPATYDPALIAALGQDVIDYFTSINPNLNLCNGKLVLDGRISNLAAVRQKGLDLSVSYRFDTRIGPFTAGTSLTRIESITASRNNGASPIPNILNYIGGPLQTRARAQLGWDRSGLSVRMFANYVGSYINDTRPIINGVTLPVMDVASWTTFDLTVAYRVSSEAATLSGLRMSLSAQNAFDRDPPYAPTSQNTFDSAAANVYGRMLSFNLTKDF